MTLPICNPNRDHDLDYCKVYYFKKSKPNYYAYVRMASQQGWYWALGYFSDKISFLYSLCSCKIRS